MSFGANSTPSTPPLPLGVPRQRGASNQQAVPVPYASGIVRCGVRWISDKFNVKTVAVSNQTGKGSSSLSGYNYYASIAFAICEGPVDAIFAIYLNGDKVWGVDGPYTNPPLKRGAPGSATADFVDITIPTHGQIRIYWGTDTQGFDPVLAMNTTLTLDDNTVATSDSTIRIKHSAYRGTCYGRADQLFLGFNQTNFQNIEVVIGKWPKPDWLTAPEKVSNDSNPIGTAGDWWSNARFGLGLSDENIDVDLMNATALRLFNEGIGISPYIDSEKEARELLVSLAQDYCGGFAIVDESGAFGIGLKRIAPDRDALPVLNATMWTARPEFQPASFEQATSLLNMTYTNIAFDLTPDYVPYRSPATKLVNENANAPVTVDRPWFTRKPLVTFMAAAEGRARALPTRTGKISLRRVPGLFEALTPGAQFLIDYPQRNLGHLMFRVTERTISDMGKPEFEIQFETDVSYLWVGLGGNLQSGNEGVDEPGDQLPMTVPSAPFVRIIELPPGLCPNGKMAVAILAARPNSEAIGFDVQLQRNYEEAW